MANLQKYTKNGCANLFAHFDRSLSNNSNQDIDEKRTNLNYNLAENQEKSQNEILKNRLSQVKVMNRKDVNVMCSWVVTLPKNYKGDEKAFFQATYNFLKGKYKAENVISAWVHKDEKTPHLHFSFVPVVVDIKKGHEKVSAKELITKNHLMAFHGEMQKYLEKELKREVPILNGATVNGNLTIKELKMAEKEKDLSDKLLKVEEAEKSVFQKKQIFEKEEKILQDKKNQFSELDKKYEKIREEVSSHQWPQKEKDFLPDLKEIKMLENAENLRENIKPSFGEKNHIYAYRVVEEVYSWVKSQFSVFQKNFNALKTDLFNTKYALAKEKEKNQELKRELNLYDYRKKPLEKLREIVKTREKKEQNPDLRQDKKKPSFDR